MSVVRKGCKMAAALLSFVLLLGMLLSLSSCRASSYTEEEHIARVTERAKERFLGEGSEYTGLEVYPVYNEYDELNYMLIEFQPQGFLYVHIAEKRSPWKGRGFCMCISPKSDPRGRGCIRSAVCSRKAGCPIG